MPMSDTEKTDLLREARERLDRAEIAERDNRAEQLEDMKFRAGEQWPEDLLTQREEDNRISLTINQMGQFIKQVTGDIRMNAPAIKVWPVDDKADPERARVFQGLIRHIEQSSNAKSAYVTAAENAATCGIGWLRIATDYSDEESFDQDIKFERILSPFAVCSDPDAKAIDKSDGEWLFFVEWIPRVDYEAEYPDAAIVDFDMTEADVDGSLAGWSSDDKVRIAEYWRKVKVGERTLCQLSDGSLVWENEYDKEAAQALGLTIVRKRVVEQKKIEVYTLSGADILEGPQDWPGRYIPFIPIIGEEISVGDRTIVQGLIRNAKDPQRQINYWRSAAVEMIALAPKAPYIMTTEQIKGHQDDWDTANVKNFPYLLYDPDPMAPGRPQRERPPDLPVSMHQLSALAADDMKSAIGLYPSSLGASSPEKSGKAILARERQGDIGTFVFIDNVAHALRWAGTILVDLIPRIYDGERVIRIVDEEDEDERVRINQPVYDEQNAIADVLLDLTVGKYDVRVDTGPSFSTRRAEAADSMLAFINAVPGAAALIGDLVAKNMDWPGAEKISKRLNKMLPPHLRDEPPSPEETAAAEQQAQTESAMTEAQIADKTAAAAKKSAEAEGQEIENAARQLELIAKTGFFEDMMGRIVAQVLAGMNSPQPTGPPARPAIEEPDDK
jgi:predicted NBD/HSP70 family sugar kinase